MPEEKQDAQAQSSGALEAAIASSPEAQEQLEQQAQDTQTPAKQEVSQEQSEQQAEEQRVPYSRFKEKVDETNWYKQQLELQLQRQQSQQPQQPTQDPYAGMTAEEEKFWRAVDARADRIAQQKLQQISPVIDAGRMELAQMKVQQFRSQHPDVKANSPEEIAIAEKIQMGYLPEDAYRSIMWDKKVAETETRKTQVSKQQMEAKKAANVEQSSIPSNAVPPKKQDFSEKTLGDRVKAIADSIGF